MSTSSMIRPLSLRRWLRSWILLGALCGAAVELSAQVGATFETLETKGGSYRSVKVLSVSPTAITIKHDGGIAQVPFTTLSPELQEQFGYDPAKAEAQERQSAEAARARQLEQEKKKTEAATARKTPVTPRGKDTPIERAMAKFGTPVTTPEIDLRPKFQEYQLLLRDQGGTPSCAVHAVLSALEYENAQVAGKSEPLSPNYLLWATGKVAGLEKGKRRHLADITDPADKEKAAGDNGASPGNPEIGYTLEEVLAAVRAYGLAPEEKEVKYLHFETISEPQDGLRVVARAITEPTEERIADARRFRRISTQPVPGVPASACLRNIMHLLSEGVPVIVDIEWPNWRSIRNGMLSEQVPLSSATHAVVLVGFTKKTDNPDDIRFIYRNSWGRPWGIDGHGQSTFRYLEKHLVAAVVVEMARL